MTTTAPEHPHVRKDVALGPTPVETRADVRLLRRSYDERQANAQRVTCQQCGEQKDMTHPQQPCAMCRGWWKGERSAVPQRRPHSPSQEQGLPSRTASAPYRAPIG